MIERLLPLARYLKLRVCDPVGQATHITEPEKFFASFECTHDRASPSRTHVVQNMVHSAMQECFWSYTLLKESQ